MPTMPPDLLWPLSNVWMEGLSSQLTFTSPPLGVQRPPGDAPLPNVWTNTWLLSITNWGPPSRKLRSSQWQEPQWQKPYYDQKIGAMDLKPGNLVLLKADAFKGKGKIKDKWENKPCEVVHQTMTDVPSYEVTDWTQTVTNPPPQ